MPRNLNKLSDVTVKAAAKAGRLSDGGGLFLLVGPGGGKSWTFMWTRDGRRREMGLGAYPTVPVSKARQRAADCRTAVEEGRDPIVDRARETEPTFGECADQLLASMEGAWRNVKHRRQWRMTLTDYCAPIRNKRVSQVDTASVLSVLTPIWSTKAATASRLRGRIERVLAFAKARGWRTGENPALWRGHLDALLPKRQKLTRGHHAAMDYADVPEFVQRLRRAEALSARAAEFLILTAGRAGEVAGARWDEVDFRGRTWNIPAGRMKSGRAHSVPLSTRAFAILEALHEVRQNDFVFPGQRPGRPLTTFTLEMPLQRLKAKPVTLHGFRSSFRDWCGDRTDFPRELAEAALAHHVGDETERAYRRSTAIEKRRELMEAWASFVDGTAVGKVVQMRRR